MTILDQIEKRLKEISVRDERIKELRRVLSYCPDESVHQEALNFANTSNSWPEIALFAFDLVHKWDVAHGGEEYTYRHPELRKKKKQEKG